MKGAVLLVLILPTVFSHIIGGRYSEDYEVDRRKHIVMYHKSKSAHLHRKHSKEQQYSDELRSDGCRSKWPVEFKSCSCHPVPHGDRKIVLDKEAGLTKEFRPVRCMGDKVLVNNTTPANYFYYCTEKYTKFNVLPPGASKYLIESLPSDCYCDLEKFPKKECSEEDY